MKEKQDFLFLVILLALLITISVIWLPFMSEKWSESEKPQVYVISSQECKAGIPCQSCVEQGRNNRCVDGICDNAGNCLVPFHGNNNTEQKGLRALALS